ncbi:hypothetical protein SAMN05216511_7287 [Streptomyces sp. KS_16]|nr:hypothetical protein SAMN05216511_7287 [Streptomyces sp. KS_16]
MTITLDRPVHTSTATAISYRDLTPSSRTAGTASKPSAPTSKRLLSKAPTS